MFIYICVCVCVYIYIYIYIKEDGNYTRMRRAVFEQILEATPTKRPLTFHHTNQIIQVIRARHAGPIWRSRDEVKSDVLLWIGLKHIDAPVSADQQGFTRISSVRTLDAVLTTCQVQ